MRQIYVSFLMINDEFVLNKFFSKKGSLCYKKIKNLSEVEKQYLDNRFKDKSESYKEIIYRIKFRIDQRPVCVVCGKPVKWYNTNNYHKTCSNKCANILGQQTIRKNCIENYGVDNHAKRDDIKEKLRESYKQNSEKIKESRIKTNLEKFGYENPFSSPEIKEKIKQYNSLNYGVLYASQRNEVKEKTKQTCKERYGVIAGWNTINHTKSIIEKYGVDNVAKSNTIKEKTKQTCINKYGDTTPLKNKCVKDKIRETCHKKYGVNWTSQAAITKKHAKENNIKKYGVEYPQQLIENRKHMSEIMSSPKIQEKRLNTLKLNGTIGLQISNEEKLTFNKLKEKYLDVINQYRDKYRYPFNCDFYIQSLDLFIECQYSWTHGGHPYNKENDKEKLELWKEKAKKSKYYQNAINTWTIRDVNKREIANKNNLNYLEFFSYKDFLKWFENQ